MSPRGICWWSRLDAISDLEHQILELAMSLRSVREATELRVYAQDAAVDPEVANAIAETEHALAAGDFSQLADARTVRKEVLKSFEAAH
jgi:hypothetical protein